MVHEASGCLQFFHSLDPTITQDSLTKMVTKTAESRITLQHHLAQILRGPQRDRVMSQFQEPREIAWCLTRQYGWPLVGLRSQVRDAQDRQRRVSCRFNPAALPSSKVYHPWCDCRKGKSDPSRLQRDTSDHWLYQGRQLDAKTEAHSTVV